MKKSTFLDPENISLEHIEYLTSIQTLPISALEMVQVHQQFRIIAHHAKLVMEFELDEAIEPAPEFRP